MTQTLRQGIVETLLAAVTDVASSAVYALPYVRGGVKVSWQVVTTGSPSAISTTIQVSLDGTNFTTIDTSTVTAGEVKIIAAIVSAKFIKMVLGTLTNGTNPTVTGSIFVC